MVTQQGNLPPKPPLTPLASLVVPEVLHVTRPVGTSPINVGVKQLDWAIRESVPIKPMNPSILYLLSLFLPPSSSPHLGGQWGFAPFQ